MENKVDIRYLCPSSTLSSYFWKCFQVFLKELSLSTSQSMPTGIPLFCSTHVTWFSQWEAGCGDWCKDVHMTPDWPMKLHPGTFSGAFPLRWLSWGMNVCPSHDISGIPWRQTAKWWIWHRGKQYQETERKKLRVTLSSICTWPCWKPKTLNFWSYMIKWITIFSLKLSEFHIWHLDPWLTKGSMITPNAELGVCPALTTL